MRLKQATNEYEMEVKLYASMQNYLPIENFEGNNINIKFIMSDNIGYTS